MIRLPQVKPYHLKPQTFKHVEITKVSEKPTFDNIFGKALIRKSEFLFITMIRQPQMEPYHLKPQTLKHVEIIKVSGKPTYDTSLERF